VVFYASMNASSGCAVCSGCPAPVKRLALIACLVHKARMRVRDNLATMFCKRVATKIKKAKAELVL
jgi:hypothetical protein